MKIITVVGARPQFIKAAAVSRQIIGFENVVEKIIHTGQHFDQNMSDVFFSELNIPHPDYNLNISGGHHGDMTGRMLAEIEKVLIVEKPDWLLIYGDTNSTLAAALAAAKLHIPIAHVEAGLRSFNMKMPEEINRIVADRISTLLFCPTETSRQNLANEGIDTGVYNVGDVMYDAALYYKDNAKQQSSILNDLDIIAGSYALTTCHRAENTDDPKRLRSICQGLASIAQKLPVVFPIHPRTKKMVDQYGFDSLLTSVKLISPLPFLDMVALEQSAKVILTDSGGIQKEAFFYRVPCITMRDETEWVETIQLGWNRLVGASTDLMLKAFCDVEILPNDNGGNPYGDGTAAKKIIEKMSLCLSEDLLN